MSDAGVLDKVRRALGRTDPMSAPPAPPAIDESITRLVPGNDGADLADVFMKRGGELKMLVERVSADELVARITSFLREQGCRRVALSVCELFEELELVDALGIAGIEATRWDRMTLDQLYAGYDCGITDVTYAVAETGSLVIKTTAAHGRGLSLVPMFHVAVIKPNQLVPDLVDLFTRLAKEGAGNNVLLISGPSKTADIEMNVVTGVHGPNVVKAFVLAPAAGEADTARVAAKPREDLSYFDSVVPEPLGGSDDSPST